MKKIKYNTNFIKLPADRFTPVNLYYLVRDRYPGALLLESSDYQSSSNSYSYLCIDPLITLKGNQAEYSIHIPGNAAITNDNSDALHQIQEFLKIPQQSNTTELDYPKGVFGYLSYDAIPEFEKSLHFTKPKNFEIPSLQFSFFRFLIAFNHFNDELTLIEHCPVSDNSKLNELLAVIKNEKRISFNFKADLMETSDQSDEEYNESVTKIKEHIKRGDVFQLVLSRSFQQSFTGDDFNVYRSLRTINPSPYLFYFDYGNFHLFGSSPEAQIQIKDNKASIYPIAGTYKRTGNDNADTIAANKLKEDKKEQAEHHMLVDLARNDLSKFCNGVGIDYLSQIQFYSHVIHLVSKITGELKDKKNALALITSSYPAGTLSGAPKFKAMELIEKYEKTNRSFYGGCIGFIGFNGDANLAIMIRSFLSSKNKLVYRAGAGIVALSNNENETNEVHHKVNALRKAIQFANQINEL